LQKKKYFQQIFGVLKVWCILLSSTVRSC